MNEKIPATEQSEKQPQPVPAYCAQEHTHNLQEFLGREDVEDLVQKNNLARPYWDAMANNTLAYQDMTYSAQTRALASHARNPSRLIFHGRFFTGQPAEKQLVVLAEELIHVDAEQSGQLEFVYQAREQAKVLSIEKDLSESIDGLLAEPIEVAVKSRLLQILPEAQTRILEERFNIDMRNLDQFRQKQPRPNQQTRADIILVDMLALSFEHQRLASALEQAGQKELANKHVASLNTIRDFRKHFTTRAVQAHPQAGELEKTIEAIEQSKNVPEYIQACQKLISFLKK